MDLIQRAHKRREQLQAELARINAFLETAKELEQEFEGLPVATATPTKRASVRYTAARGTGAETLRAVAEIIDEQGPKSTRELVPIVQARGIEVGGKDAVATLSARISKKGVVALSDGKWHRIVPSSASRGIEAADESVEERSAASLFNQGKETTYAAALT